MVAHRPGLRGITLGTACVFAGAMGVLLFAALFPVFPRQFDIELGDTASRTLRSPRDAEFESAFQTEQRREEAANAIPESVVFDPNVRVRQIEEYDATVATITQVRNRATDPERKRDELLALGFSDRSTDVVLALPPDRWQAVQDEARRILFEQLGVSLDDTNVGVAKDTIESRITDVFSAEEALSTAELVRPLIVPTLLVDAARTEQARAAARASVAPERISVNKDDVIVNADAEVDQVALEKLRAAGVLSNRVEGRNVAAIALLSAVTAVLLAGYLYVLQPGGVTSHRHLVALAVVATLPLLVGKFYLPIMLPDQDRHFLAFLLPIAAASMLIAALLETQLAVVVGGLIGVLLAFVSVFVPDVSLVASIGAIDSMRVLLVYGIAPVAGIYVVHGADRLHRYLTAGIAVAAVSFLFMLSTWFIDGDRAVADVAWMGLATGMGGVGSGLLAAGAFVTVGVVFGVTTRVQLMELGQLNSPLLRRLQDEAPGTFHHSVIVANLAERAADKVGADAMLARVGCYYHDIGKVLQPAVYIENQLGGDNPHEGLAPEESAALIRQHVENGLELARRERLPARIAAFIPEHHGTRLVTYFYRKAHEEAPGIDTAPFQYPGPRPQSRETAIVMLADSTEALIRSSEDRSAEAIDRLVDEVIAERLAEGQLDDSDLTLRDLRTIAASFKTTMAAVYHPRVQYPAPTALEARRRLLRLPLLAPGAGRPNVTPVPPRERKID